MANVSDAFSAESSLPLSRESTACSPSSTTAPIKIGPVVDDADGCAWGGCETAGSVAAFMLSKSTSSESVPADVRRRLISRRRG